MDNKVVLITGAAKRIGAAIARHLHQSGLDIILHYHQSEAEALQLERDFNSTRPGSAMIIQADLKDSGCYKHIIEQTQTFKSRLDGLINNASAFYTTPLDAENMEQWSELMDINLKAPYFLSLEAANFLRERNGFIINITDIYGFKPLKHFSIYSISKAGLIAMTQALAKELAPEIRVNAIAPGAIDWPDDISEEKKQIVLNTTLLKRQGSEKDITNAVGFLINNADYITGETITVDGGRNINL